MVDTRPSNAYIWSNCAAAPSFQLRVPEEPESDPAREGTAAAWVADAVLKGDATHADDMVGKSHSNGWLVTPDMAYYVQLYVDLIESFGGTTTTELFGQLTAHIKGTLDASTALASGTLRVTDLKFGYEIVDVFENPQCILYGAMELNRLNAWQTVKEIIIGIYQPRASHPDGTYRTQTFTAMELYEATMKLIAASEACQQPNPVATPGPHCKHCRAKLSCVANAHSNYANYTVIADHRQMQLTPDQKSAEFQFLSNAKALVTARLTALDAEIQADLRRGTHIRGVYMKERLSDRAFTVDPMTIQLLTGTDPYDSKDRPIVTPAELERRGADPAKVATITTRKKIGYSLKPMPDDFHRKAFSK